MTTSLEGYALIESWEDVVLSACRDRAGILTIGVDHTSAAGEHRVTASLTITARQASEVLTFDLAIFEIAVKAIAKVLLIRSKPTGLSLRAFRFSHSALAGGCNKEGW